MVLGRESPSLSKDRGPGAGFLAGWCARGRPRNTREILALPASEIESAIAPRLKTVPAVGRRW